jgi:putative ABC transport system permease protein
MRNLRLAFRRLARAPFISLVAVVSLALGIGANAAIFSLFEQTLLRSLPVQEPGRLVNLAAPGPKPGSQSCGQAGDCEAVFSYPMFRDLERDQKVFTGVSAHVAFGANLAFQGQTLSGQGTLVSGSYFPVLGVRPALGRLFDENDDKNIGGHFITVLSHAYWTSRLGASDAVLNSTIVINGQSMTIVGVAPRGFTGTTLGAEPDVFVTLTMRALMTPGWKGFDNRRSYWAYLFARLKPGVSIDQARTAINVPYHAIINEVEAPLQKGMSDQTMARFKARQIQVEPGQRGQSDVHKEAKAPLLLLFGITGIVLLIACANIANLLLARAAGRATEMAVRLSIGASRRQLLAQLLTESVVLAALGAVAGLLVARWTLGSIASLLPADAVKSFEMGLQPTIVAFAAVLSVATGFLFGIFPALHSTRPDLVSTLKAQAGQPSGARAAAYFRTGLVITQITLSMALLASAGLFVKSLRNVTRVDLGVKIDNVVTFGISPELNGYTPERARQLFERAEQELAAMPGVTSVATSMVPLLGGSNWGSDVNVQGFQSGPDIDSNARFNEVSAGYFRAMGIPLLSGREFTAADGPTAPKAVIVNEAFTKKFNLGRDAVGRRMSRGNAKLDTEIVGVVQNAKYSDVKQDVPPLFFLPYRQDEGVGSINVYVRAALPPEQILRTIPAVMARLDPNLPLENLKTMPQQVKDNMFLDRMISTLSAAFAILATILAAVGLYGVLAYTVSQRTREFGLRMALGADGARVRGMVMRQVGWMTLVGAVLGIAGAYYIGKAASSLLFEIKGADPVVFAAATALLAIVAMTAGFIPALRASRIEPMRALRYE